MFHVTAVNLTPDLTSAQPDLGRCDLGPVDRVRLVALLDAFCRLDPVQNHDANPALIVASERDQFLLRTYQGRLLLFDPRASRSGGLPVDPAEVPSLLTQPRPEFSRATRSRVSLRRLLAAGLLAVALAADVWIVARAFRQEPLDAPPNGTPMTDVGEIVAFQEAAAGTYRTGPAAGDRMIRIGADRRIEFFQLTGDEPRLISSDTFDFVRDGRPLRLVTTAGGTVDVTNIDTLVYYRDTYRRTR